MFVPSMNRSEIAALLTQIDAEHYATREALYGLAAGNTRHDFINARMQHLHAISQPLIEKLGKDAALPLIVSAMDHQMTASLAEFEAAEDPAAHL